MELGSYFFLVRTCLKVYMELGSYFLFLQEQIKDIIIIFTGMMQDGLQTVGPLGGGGGNAPPTSHASLAPPEFE